MTKQRGNQKKVKKLTCLFTKLPLLIQVRYKDKKKWNKVEEDEEQETGIKDDVPGKAGEKEDNK